MGRTDIAKTAWMLALAGLVPFAVLALALLVIDGADPMHRTLLDSFRLYSAVVLSFLGGIRWGLALVGREGGGTALLASVLPAIVAWTAMFLPPGPGLAVLLLTYCAQGAWDSITFHRVESMVWFARLRVVLTLLVAAAHIAAMAGLR